MSFGINPKPQLLNPEILRHQTVGRHSAQAEAKVWDPLSTPANQQVYYTMAIIPGNRVGLWDTQEHHL